MAQKLLTAHFGDAYIAIINHHPVIRREQFGTRGIPSPHSMGAKELLRVSQLHDSNPNYFSTFIA